MSTTHDELPPSHTHDSDQHEQPGIADPDNEVNDNPIEQVRLTVPITDDPSECCLTFRMWTMGITSCVILSFLNQFFGYRNNNISVSSVCAQLITLPLGKFMARTLPTRYYKVPLINWSFTLNPGPFSLKEHVLLTILASGGSVYALYIITVVKVFYHRGINLAVALLLAQSTQFLGYGWAGLFRKYLVDSPYMWWPGNLVSVSLFRALHEDEKRVKGRMTRLQFFIAAMVVSFAYYVIPGFFFPSITALSFVCWIWKDSVIANIIGSGNKGLGIGSFALDWSTITMFGNPIATPPFAIVNTLFGYVFIMYVLLPISYWTNTYEAKKFPILSSHVFDYMGKEYNTTRVLDDATFSIDYKAYDSYSKINLSVFWVYTYGLGFGALAATLSHVMMFNGGTIMRLWRQTKATANDGGDIHNRLMKKNYEQVPHWWFQAILFITIALSLITCEGFGRQLQLPYWGILLACAIAFLFTLPVGVINATTNQGPGLNIITELVIGYLYPGKPMANVTFKTYGAVSITQALSFVQDFKLGHYMKIPPKAMFWTQFVGTLVSTNVNFATAWWLLNKIPNICEVDKLPEASPWTCPGFDVFYNASIIWGVVGPLRMFGPLGLYPEMNYFFLIGFIGPVIIWFFARKFPNQKWIPLINLPIIFSATGSLPIAKPAAALPWFLLAAFFNIYVYKRYKDWWARNAFVMSSGFDAGIAFFAVLIFFTLQSKDIFGVQWWGMELTDHCPLASCPTAPGIVVKGCPVY